MKLYTPHHDKKHCFKETIDGSLEVEVHGNLFPRTIFGKCVAMCAWIRMYVDIIKVNSFQVLGCFVYYWIWMEI